MAVTSVSTRVLWNAIECVNARSVQVTEHELQLVDISRFSEEKTRIRTGRRPVYEVIVKTLEVPEEDPGNQWFPQRLVSQLEVDYGGLGYHILGDFALIAKSVDMAVDSVVEFTWIFRGCET